MRFSIRFLLMVMAFVASFFAGRASLTPRLREYERRDNLQEQHLRALETERSKYEARILLARQKLSEEEALGRANYRELERTRYELERGRRGPFLIPVRPPFDR